MGYKDTADKLSKVTEDGLRINLYPKTGIVTTQLPGQSHGEYKSGLPKDFKDMSQAQMSDYAFSFFRK